MARAATSTHIVARMETVIEGLAACRSVLQMIQDVEALSGAPEGVRARLEQSIASALEKAAAAQEAISGE